MANNPNTSPDMKDQIKVCVVSSKGEVTTVECKTRLSVDRIKLSALTNFIGDQIVALRTVDQYRMLSIHKKRVLSCVTAICDEDIAYGDTLLLLDNSSDQGEPSKCDEPSSRVPTRNSILEATRCVLPKNREFHVRAVDVADQFDRDLRPMLVTLLDYMSRILQCHPEVEPILKDLQIPDREGPEREEGARNKRKSDSMENEAEGFDSEALKQLTDMGFSADRSKRALRMSHMSPTEAMDWLLAYGTSSSTCVQPVSIPSTSSSQLSPLITTIYPRVPAVIECIMKSKRRNFKPTESLLNNLKQLGLNEDEIIDAMWRFKNNEILTTEWLINGNRPKLNYYLCRGLTYDHPFIKEILNSYDLLRELTKPDTFYALVYSIEYLDPNQLLDDEMISPLIKQLFKLYEQIYNLHEDDGTHVSESVDN